MLRSGMVWVLAFVCSNTFAQQNTERVQDSVVFQEVIIRAAPHSKFLAGSTVTKVDSSLMNVYGSGSLNDAISFQAPVYFRTYGNGMISISMRGTSPSHTAVQWNGININSFSLGQADFSILPIAAADDISIHEGGGSARFGSGAIGGTILLNTFSDNKPLLFTRQEIGSFGRWFSSAGVSIRSNKVKSSTRFYRQQLQGDYPVLQQGIVQDISLKTSSQSELKASYWFHDADRLLRPNDGSAPVENTQLDRNHRLSVSYEHRTRNHVLSLGSGFVNDKIIYNGLGGSVIRGIAFANYQRFISDWTIEGNAYWNHIISTIPEHPGKPTEDRVDLLLAAQRSFKHVDLSINVRQPLITGIRAPLLPYAGINVHLTSNWTWQANASRNFRAPTLNDRYWIGLGNPDLKSESTYSTETGIQFSNSITTIRATAFYQHVNDWIQWVPETDGQYRPRNIREVEASGFQTVADLRINMSTVTLKLHAAYEFTRSIVQATDEVDKRIIGKQLIYTPQHTGTASLTTVFKSWSLMIFNQFTGIRYGDDFNDKLYSLEPFILTDASVSKTFSLNRHVASLQFTARNVFNINYQLYAARTMPGSNYSLAFTWQLNQKQSTLKTN